MTSKAILLFIAIGGLFILLLAALVVTAVIFVKKRGGKKGRMALLNLPNLSAEEKRMLRTKKGHTGSARSITTSSPEATAKIIKSWLTKE